MAIDLPKGKVRQLKRFGLVLASLLALVLGAVGEGSASASNVQKPNGSSAGVHCSREHVSGYWHAECKIKNPVSFHIAGNANQPYTVAWSLSCESKATNNSHLGSAVFYSRHSSTIVDGFSLAPNAAEQKQMQSAAKCTLDITFRRARTGVVYLLLGAITINDLPREVIYD